MSISSSKPIIALGSVPLLKKVRKCESAISCDYSSSLKLFVRATS